MRLNLKIASLLSVALVATQLSFSQTVKRGRNEGTFYIPASNVMGNGNITAYLDMSGILTSKKAEVTSGVGAGIGIAEILQFTAQTSFINFQRFGPTEMHLHATLPGNDNVRFFGVGAIADLYLSTSIDTLDPDADITKPNYNPYTLATVIFDLDWLARPKQIPLKTYVCAGLMDNAKLLYEYKQMSFKAGVEWKLYRNSFFADIGLGMYKVRNVKPGENSRFDQMYGWISPGARYRFFNRFSLLGNLRWTFFRSIDHTGSLDPEKLSIAVKLEAPILYRETNTEAIRTLVFMEKTKKEEVPEEEKLTKEIKSEIDLLGKFDNSILDLKDEDETFNYDKEKDDLIRRREEIKRNMKEIENLLKEDEE